MAASITKYLISLACFALATEAASPLSYRSFKTVLSNFRAAPKIDPKCMPTCKDSNGDPIAGHHIRDPARCDQYWVCLPNGTIYEHPHVCESGEIVNVNVDEVVCEPMINDGSNQCTIPDPDCDPSIPKVCYTQETCPPPADGIFAYPDVDDCNKYHVCHFSATLSCENKGFFDGQECVDDKSKCCECQAVCREEWRFIPNPSDGTCNSYYLCQDLESRGYPYIATEEEMFVCPDGQKIDVSTGECSDSATCVPKPNCTS